MKFLLHVLVRQEKVAEGERFWVAQCLDHDFTAQGDTPENAVKSFVRTAARYIKMAQEKGHPPFSRLSKAPEPYWRLFDERAQKWNTIPRGDLAESEADVRMLCPA